MIYNDNMKKENVYLVKPALLVMLRVETLAWQWSLRLEDDIRVRDSVSNPGFLVRRNKIDRRINLYTLNDYGDFNTMIFLSGFLFRADVVRKRVVNKMSRISDRWEFIGSKIKLNFHIGRTGAGGGLGGLARVLVLGRHDDGEGVLLPFVANKDLGNGLDGVDDDGRLLFSRKDTRAMILVHNGGKDQFFLGELDTNEFKLKRWIRARRKKDLVHLEIFWMLEFIKKNLSLLADRLDIGGGIGENVKWGRIMIGTETKELFNKAIKGLGKYEVPCKDGGSGVATHPLDSHNVVRQKLEVEHLEDKVTENAEGRLAGRLVTRGKSLSLDLETSAHVFTIDTVNSFIDEGLQGIVIQGELLMAFLELLLACLQGSQANFGGIRHLGNVSYWTLDSDKGGWDRRGKRECYGAWVDECYWPTFVLILILFLCLFSVQFKCSVGKKILEIVGI